MSDINEQQDENRLIAERRAKLETLKQAGKRLPE